MIQRCLNMTLLTVVTVVPGITCASDREIEEIVVTATRRQANLQDVSASLSAITSDDISRQGIDDLAGFARTLPGVSLHQIVKNRSTFTVRGINTDIGDTQLTQEPVAVYINDMSVTQPYAALVQADLRLYDVDRIEVLRGPQGTLFGSGSLGGLVRIITNKPDLEQLQGSLRVDLADTRDAGGRYRYDGMINLPLSDSLAVRVVGYARDEAGWIENINLNTDNSSDDWGGRFSVLYQPTDNFEARLEWILQDSKPEDGDTWDPSLGKFKRSTILPEGRKARFEQLNITLEYDFSFAKLISSSNVQDTESDWFAQLAQFPGIGVLTVKAPRYDTEFFSEELRLISDSNSNVEWVAGLYYVESKTNTRFQLEVSGLADFVNSIVFPGFLANDDFYVASVETRTEELAAFADLTYHFSDQWSASAGLRIFDTTSTYDAGVGSGFDFASFSAGSIPAVSNKGDDSASTWRAVVAYKPAQGRHFYASLSKGYRVGQVNPNFGASLADPDDFFIPATYENDESINLELGAKTRWLDDQLQLNASIYRIDWTDIQVDAVRRSDQLSYIANAGDAISTGLEIEMTAWPSEQLNIRLSLTFQDAEINDVNAFQSLASGAVNGDRLPGAADFLAAAGVEYHWNLRQFMVISRLDAQYAGDSLNRFSQAPQTGMPHPDLATNESYTNVNASVSAVTDKWEVMLYVENLSNNDDAILNAGVTFGNQFVSLRPRTLGVRFEYFF
jgi:iron complex outermembrane recepter protein